MLKRVVTVVQVIVLGLTVFTAVELGVKDPAALKISADVPAGELGKQIYGQACAGCHGPNGEGQYGPKLGGGAAVARFPDKADEVRIVANGRGSMPAWSDTLKPAEIDAVVDYTRSGLLG
ncbi:MAG TPA: cytochrome c [Acidimicrobiales bacterium]|jgi:mono/diheme cytochrome c family protein|nr:cytochrome c [Acidimicrobiales bacterium]